MVIAANSGVTRPAKAIGHGDEVVGEGEREVLEDPAAGGAGEAPARGDAVEAVAEHDQVGGASGWRRPPRRARSRRAAAASAAASLRPSPTISTRRPSARSGVEARDLCLRRGARRSSRRCRAGRRGRRPGARRRPRAAMTARPASRERRDGGGGLGAELVGEGEGDRGGVADAEPGGGDAARRVAPTHSARPRRTGRPSRRPSVPRPGCSAMSVTAGGRDGGGRVADGAGERVGAGLRRARRRRRRRRGGMAAALVRTGRPVVSVPVLSKTTVSISARRSSAVPSFSSTPVAEEAGPRRRSAPPAPRGRGRRGR